MNFLQKLLFISSGIVTVSILVIILLFILVKGFSVIDFKFIFSNTFDSGKSGGIFPMIVSSIYLVALTALISIPIGVGSAIYVSQYCNNLKFVKSIEFISQVLSALPSVVYGLFGFAFIVIFLKMGWSILSASLVLSLMSIPVIFQVSLVSLNSVDCNLMEASLGLGAKKYQAVMSVILPAAFSSILTGIILALTRAISEAAAVMYVVGSTFTVPLSIFDAGRPLPLHLYILASEGISMENAYGTAGVLIMMVLAMTILSNYLINRYQSKLMGDLNEN